MHIRRLRLAVIALMVVSFMGAVEHTIVATSLATIAGELGALEQMSWVVVSYTLASTVLIPILGKLGDVVGARRVFIVSLVAFLVASAVCGFADDIFHLLLARLVQGAASAGINLMSQTIIGEITTPRQRPHYLSLVGATFPVAILIGPALGGLITDTWGWRWVFWINVPIGLVALTLVLIAIPVLPGRRSGSFDIIGSLLIGGCIVASVFVATWLGAGDPSLVLQICTTTVLAVILLVLFLRVEHRAVSPLVPLSHFSNRTFTISIVLGLIIGIGLFSVVSFVPTFVQMVYGTSATISGVVPIAMVFGMLIASLVTGWLASRTGRYRLFPVIGSLLSVVGLTAMALLPVGTPIWAAVVAMGVVGLGTGAFMNIILATAQSAVPREEVGAATATSNLVRQIGSSVGTAVVGSLIGAGIAASLPASIDPARLTPQIVHASTEAVKSQVAHAFVDVMAPIFLALAALNLIGFFCALLLPTEPFADDDRSPLLGGPDAASSYPTPVREER